MDKKELRKKYIKIRNSIENREEKSHIITQKIKKHPLYQNAKVVAFYNSFSSEVNTKEIIEYSINIGKTVVLPRVNGENMDFYKITSASDMFIKSSLGVQEPIANNELLISKENIDLMIIPGLCFDSQYNRLGYGKGYYDRYLAGTSINTIGICFNEQFMINDILPIDDNDIKLTEIITN